jgi:O-antigen/teichoic acid export membrane protein
MVKPRAVEQKFIRDVFSTILTKIFLVILKLGSSVLTARFLGATGRGEFFGVTQLAGIINTIGTLSIGEGLIYFLSTHKLKEKHCLATVLFFVIFFSIPIWGFILCLYSFTDFLFPADKKTDIFIIVCALIPLFMCEYLGSSVFKGLKRFKFANKISVFCRTVLLISIFFSLVMPESSVVVVLFAFVLAYLAIALIYLLLIGIYLGFSITVPIHKLKRILKYSVRVHPIIFISEIEYRLDVFVLIYFLDFASLGIYSIGVSFGQLVWYVSNSINNVAFPNLAETENLKKRLEFFQKIVRYNILLNCLIILLMMLSGYWLIYLIFGEQFQDAFGVFIILSFGFVFDTISRNMVTWFKSANNPNPVTLSTIMALILNVILNILLIPIFGLFGAAFASTISYIVRSCMIMYAYSQVTKTNIFTSLVPRRNDLIGIINLIKIYVFQKDSKLKREAT